ncbi:putative esterase of the alpha-beta hydrolase superfamily [Desulfocurvibacter africanus PCS]|uniref:Putative esterase of the alpha-beta hydrolase superfamily n=1 Tax=Desulfocurvibacter africanus PCS TaxID=1262666 RepID=M5PTI1_DESAF|nr:patatin-like phospholipase family protein [Desulfocurvibacter africanus]EMG37350.1 putative esterase of the alpha-beta hydrolase superfamily [Desulfocurvibacter africanus PCS]
MHTEGIFAIGLWWTRLWSLLNRRFDRMIICMLAVVALAGCAGVARKDAVPEDLTTQAVVPGMADVRYRSGIDQAEILREGIASFYREQAYLASIGHRGAMPPAVFLAISGGGDNGAFGAGLLNGWTVAGNRPEFKLVTGVSTGALIAPFAFLGPAYDDELKRFYTTVSPSDVATRRWFLAAITSDALTDNAPLWKLVENAVDQALLDAIAVEYEKGRLLLVATVDLDARQSVLWNMTKIAASRDPKALDLFRSILIASSAIPVAFPPVMIDVEANAQEYQEMHVDGGTMSQVFVYPPSLRVGETSEKYHVVRERKLYVIRNARLDPEWASVDRRAMSIGERAISSLIHTQGIGDLYTIYLTSKRDGVDYNLAFIPASFDAKHQENFDTEYMRALFRTGFDMAAKGYPWDKTPPGF